MIFRVLGLCAALSVGFVSTASAQMVRFGDDSGDYANDGECDDRRFIGFGMASVLSNSDNFKDASDCKFLFNNGFIKPVSEAAGVAATQCDAVKFGDNSSEYADDGECDDPRFDGPGSVSAIGMDDLLRDSNDCIAACARGSIWLRTAVQ